MQNLAHVEIHESKEEPFVYRVSVVIKTDRDPGPAVLRELASQILAKEAVLCERLTEGKNGAQN